MFLSFFFFIIFLSHKKLKGTNVIVLMCRKLQLVIESIKSRDDASVCKNKVCFNKTYENYQVSLLKTSKTTRKIRAMICLHDSSEIIARSQNFFLLWYSVDDFSTHLIVSTFILPDITGRTAPGGGGT